MQLSPGARLGVYEIVTLLGSGGMGTVYKARDTRLDRPVAIKLLADTFSRDSRARRYVQREAKAISRLNHPHICTLYDIGHDEGADYLVMEFLAGETVAQQLTRGPLPIDDVLRYAIQVGEALAEAHRKGLLHRDLKPGNIMVTANGAKVLDFGLAIAFAAAPEPGIEPPTASTLTSEHRAVGTLPYMAPEQLDGRDVDARTDVFAFGALVYEMTTGRRAFEGTREAGVMTSVLSRHPPPIASVRPGTPAALARLVKKCLAKNAADRWQTFDDVVVALKSIRVTDRHRMTSGGPPRGRVRQKGPTVRRLVVLPFENLSSEQLEDYVPDGLTDALTATLSGIAQLKVIARSSSVHVRGLARQLPELAQELDIDAAIRGSISGDSDRVHVRVELVQATTNRALWNGSYDSPTADVLRMQKEISDTIAMELRLSLTPADRKRTAEPLWSKVREANEAYLRARYHADRGTIEGVRRSHHYLSIALQKDPSFGRAYAALAEWYVSASPYRLVVPSEALPKAKSAAIKAIELDPTLADAHTCLGMIAMLEWDVQRARGEFTQALRINPNSANATRSLARCSAWLGKHAEAAEQIELTRQLDPVSPKTYLAMASIFYAAGAYERAVDAAAEALELEGGSEPGQYFLGMAHHFAGRSAKAIELLRAASRECPSVLSGLAFVLGQSGLTEDALRVVEDMKEHAARHAEVSPYDFAEAYAGLGDSARALNYLERSCELRLLEMMGVAVDPVFTSLHSHPAFQKILHTVGLGIA